MVRAEYASVLTDTQARVLQVIDGDALKLELSETREIALVRLAGITTQGNADALAYMTARLLGRNVDIRIETAFPGVVADGRWTPVYVYDNNTFYNRMLLQKGLACVDEAYAGYSQYSVFVEDQRSARSRRTGLWATGSFNAVASTVLTYSGGTRINMNTATAAQIQNALTGVSLSAARTIVRYREDSPYNQVSEVKFSGALTREQFEDNAARMTVCTDINAASAEELRQLGLTASEARAIINYRKKTAFKDLEELYSSDLITKEKYKAIEPYIALFGTDRLENAIPDKTADINRDEATALRDAGAASGLTANMARTIVEARAHGYTYKTLGELRKLNGVNLTTDQINQLADNLRRTPAYNLNNVPAYTNINTASYETLLTAGFTQNQAVSIRSAQSRRMRSGSDIPFDLGAMDAYATLYTNINVTTTTELLSLSSYMTPYFASVLINAAAAQPFGSLEELSDFCDAYGESDLYNQISNYIVLR